MRINLRLFDVYPVHENVFKVNIKGRTALPDDLAIIKDLETFEPNIDGNVEEWSPLDQEGWIRRMVTGKGFSISFTGKRNVGDPGNDYVADECALATGAGANSAFEWVFPNGAKIAGNCVINVTTMGGGDSTNVAGLEFELLSDGKPTFTPAVG